VSSLPKDDRLAALEREVAALKMTVDLLAIQRVTASSDLLSVMEAAKRFRMHERTIRRYAQLPGVGVRIGKRLYVRRNEIERQLSAMSASA
jgi:hypothetical protein